MELIIHARSVYVLESFPGLEVGHVLYVDLAVVLGGYYMFSWPAGRRGAMLSC